MEPFGILAVLVCATCVQIDATHQSQNGNQPTRPIVTAAERSSAIQIDGRLDEENWARASVAQRFIQGEPVEGAEVRHATEVRVLFDGAALYFGARLLDDPTVVRRQLSRRDEQGEFDYFDISLSPYDDRLTGYRFRITASGVQSDWYLYDDTREDNSWDAVWSSAVHHDAKGWSVEARIPLSQLRFNPAETAQRWGVNFSRRRVASNERSYLALESRQQSGRVSVFAVLDGLLLPTRPTRLEVRPYTLGGLRSAPAEAGNPFFNGRDVSTNAGLDVRAGLGSFTLNATINPDFGQVEVDPAVINLSAFETFFPERRPFFVQDSRLVGFSLSGGQNALFYTRRIGREPQVRSVEGADFVDVPSQTRILGAAKLAGRIHGGLSLGALFSLSGRAVGQGFSTTSNTLSRFVAEPRTVSGVVSAQQELRGGATQLGATLTTIHRSLPEAGDLDQLIAQAWSAGVNFEHSWSARRWALTGFFAGSIVGGDSVALIRLQRSSNHYFQRPDAPREDVDSSATSLRGHEWRLQLDKRSGRHWTGGAWIGERTSGFDINDLGFSQGSERLDVGTRIVYGEITPGSLLRSYRVNFTTFHNWRHEALDAPFSAGSWRGAYKRGSFNLNFSSTFLNYWDAEFQVRGSPTNLSDGATRGGPIMEDPGEVSWRLELTSDRRRAVSVEGSLDVTVANRGGSSRTVGLDLAIQPSPSISIGLGPTFRQETTAAQYVTTVEDPTATATFGNRYVFSDLERRTFSLDTRVNLTFSPTLTLQVFAQPLLSTGDYLSYKTLSRPRSFAFDVLAPGNAVETNDGVRCEGGRSCLQDDTQYLDVDGDGVLETSFDNRDFRVRALRSNVVLRWEYRPGSAIFLVWQQRRDFRDAQASGFNPGREFGRLFGDPTENLLTVKATYWLGL